MGKFCTNCGQKLDDNATFCYSCGKKLNETTEKVEEKETKNAKENNHSGVSVTTQKSKIAAGLFGIFLGGLGIHNFYLGYNSKGTTQLLLTVLSLGLLSFISAIWGLVEGVQILMGNITDADGNELVD